MNKLRGLPVMPIVADVFTMTFNRYAVQAKYHAHVLGGT